MNDADRVVRRAVVWMAVCLLPLGLMIGLHAATPPTATAQPAAGPPEPSQVTTPPATDPAGAEGGPSAADPPADDGSDAGEPASDEETSEEGTEEGKGPNWFELLIDGGFMMIPILALSLLVVTFGVERGLGLQSHKVLPPELTDGLGALASQQGGLDPRRAYRLCQQFPSAAASVIKTMLLKIGRPHAEVEHTVSEANDREAEKLYANVRWLSLAARVAPLMGLLGTVLGMIEAFIATANMPLGANKAEFLARGIYKALVTTCAGLAVAIPAAVLAHWFEGRIQRLFRELDETLLGLMPQLERFEGRLRVSRDQMEMPAAEAAAAPDRGGLAQRPATATPE